MKVHLDPGDGGYVVAECPALPGCASQGKTREEALANIREAIEGWRLEVQDDRAGLAGRPEGVGVVEVAI